VDISVVVPTHNPDPERFRRALLGLRAQTLAPALWETVIVDNASSQFPDAGFLANSAPARHRVVAEPELGLSAARKRGFSEATGRGVVLVDDDNVLAPDYLENVLRIFALNPKVGAIGGVSAPEFEREPDDWQREFFGLLALRDLGPHPLISKAFCPPGTMRGGYPVFAPIGAGMAIRRDAASVWAESTCLRQLSDRRGDELTSAGDNDIVLTIMRRGWEVGYFPELRLTHVIPATRLEARYLERLNRGIQQSWMRVLSMHGINPWPPLNPIGARLRKVKAWWSYRAWSSPAARIRWQGACGHFEGRIAS